MRNYTRADNQRVFTCMGCDWFRDVASGKEGQRVFVHRVYGRVTHARAATLDIDSHVCFSHVEVLRMVYRMLGKAPAHV